MQRRGELYKTVKGEWLRTSKMASLDITTYTYDIFWRFYGVQRVPRCARNAESILMGGSDLTEEEMGKHPKATE